MRQNSSPYRLCTIVMALLVLCAFPAAFARTKKIKPIKATANRVEFVAFSENLSKQDRFHQAVDRLTFGERSGDLDRIRALGLQKWLDRQLHPERFPESPALLERLAPLESLNLSIHDAYLRYPSPQTIAAVARGKGQLPADPELRVVVERLADRYLQKKDLSAPATAAQDEDADLAPRVKLADLLTPDQIALLRNGTPEQKQMVLQSIPRERWADFSWALSRREKQRLYAITPAPLRRQMMLTINPQTVLINDLSEAKILRAVYSDNQLQELLVDFWFNHFNVFLNKGADRYLVSTYERDAIRPYVFGKFYDMLQATAKSPAMMFYLDNWQSVGPEAQGRARLNQKAKRGLNENYGRELLELHTLGVDGGYTQQDVIEVARCFTGWTIAGARKGGDFEFNAKMHDNGSKIVLGHVIPAGGGMQDGYRVLQILAAHPSTAHFVSLRLAQRFVADDPPPSLVNRMARTFTKTGGDLRQVMETMLYSGEFFSAGSYRAKVKTPFEMVVSAVRATDADVTSAFLLTNQLQRLGQPLYCKLEPTGYSVQNADWLSSASLLDRLNFAILLSNNKVPGVRVDAAWKPAGLSLGSPEFQRR